MTPSTTGLRGATAADSEARSIPGRKSPYGSPPPIDLPDDFGADDAETDGDGVISWMAAVLVVVAIIAAVLIFAVPA